MFCQQCGAPNASTTVACTKCGKPLLSFGQSAAPEGEVNTWLVPAIISTICCCLPFGIASIVFAAQAKALLEQGHYTEAVAKAQQAKLWFWWAFGIGLLINVGFAALQVMGLLAGMAGALEGMQ